MIRIIAVVVTLLGSVPFFMGPGGPEHHEPVPPPPADPGLRVVAHLPASSAWVAAPFRAVGDVEVWGWATTPPQAHDAHFSHDVLMTIVAGQDDGVGVGGGWGVASHVVEANANGKRLVCCSSPVPYERAPGENGFQLWLTDGQVLYVAFIGANVDESVPFDLQIGVRGGTLAPLLLQEGTDVRAVDLVDEANARGLNVRLGGQTLAGAPAPVDDAFAAVQNGFAFLSYHLEGDAAISFAADGETLVSREGSDLFGMAYRLGASEFDVRFQPAAPGAPALPGQQGEWSTASILYADLDLPGEAFAHYE